MTLEQKKAWLYRYQDSLHRQEILAIQIKTVWSGAISIKTTYSGVETASTGLHADRVADAVQRIDELKRKYVAEVEQSYRIYDEIQTAIEALPDIMQIMVTYYRYLQGMKVDCICSKLDCSKTTVTRLLSNALDALELPEDALEK